MLDYILYCFRLETFDRKITFSGAESPHFNDVVQLWGTHVYHSKPLLPIWILRGQTQALFFRFLNLSSALTDLYLYDSKACGWLPVNISALYGMSIILCDMAQSSRNDDPHVWSMVRSLKSANLCLY